MNSRIKELEKQAVFYKEETETWELNVEKFDKLIVRECANKQLSLASNYEVTVTGYEPAFPEFVEGTVNGLREGAELIKQHFGVEE